MFGKQVYELTVGKLLKDPECPIVPILPAFLAVYMADDHAVPLAESELYLRKVLKPFWLKSQRPSAILFGQAF